jgi:hypothetical protein
MTHRAAASAQVGLSYFFLAGFFACIYLDGRGIIKGVNPFTDLKDPLMLILYFWFQRTRDSASEAPAAGTLSGHQVPPPPSGVTAHVQPAPAESAPIAPVRNASSPPSAPGGGSRPAAI